MTKIEKPSRFKTPQRSTESAGLDKWVEAGAGTGATLSVSSEEKPARLTIDLRPELHARFKAACALRGSKMVAEVTRFIEDYTERGNEPTPNRRA